jgi:hypothetical protein
MSSPEWQIPSLTDVLKVEHGKSRCAWYKSKRERGLRVKCSSQIRKEDVEDATSLFKTLDVLDKTNPAYDETLHKLSSLILCRGHHRLPVNAREIHDAWILGPQKKPSRTESAPVRSPITPSLSVSPVGSVPDIRKLLGITEGMKLTCHGVTASNGGCSRPISQKTYNLIMITLAELARSWVLRENLMLLLETLARAIMCQRSHQSQYRAKYDEWMRIFPNRNTSLQVEAKQVVRPTRSSPIRVPNAERVESPTSTASLVFTPPDSSRIRTPDTSPLANIRPRVLESSSPLENLHDYKALRQNNTTSVRKVTTATGSYNIRTTRSSSLQSPSIPLEESGRLEINSTQDKGLANPVYAPFPHKSPSTVTENILKKVQSAVSTLTERKHGFIYGYQRPNGAGSSSHIKIGYAEDVDRRMKQWSDQCKYKPIVVIRVETDCARRVERLVHMHLHAERKRELLVSGCCNGGIGCASKHQEWFEVSIARATQIIKGWADWFKCQPYDQTQEWVLKPEWHLRTKGVFGSRGDFWVQFWLMEIERVVVKDKNVVKNKTVVKNEVVVKDEDKDAKVEFDPLGLLVFPKINLLRPKREITLDDFPKIKLEAGFSMVKGLEDVFV